MAYDLLDHQDCISLKEVIRVIENRLSNISKKQRQQSLIMKGQYEAYNQILKDIDSIRK